MEPQTRILADFAPAIPAQSPPLRRDKSYRKPVPEYIPSPPASPSPVVPGVANAEQEALPEHEGDALSLIHEGILPQSVMTQENKVDINVVQEVRQIVQERGIGTASIAITDTTTFSRHHSFLQSASSEDYEKSPSVPTSPTGTKRRLPQTYRPPTPPINTSSTKLRKLPTEEASVSNHEFLAVPRVTNFSSRSSENHGLYPPITRPLPSAGSSRTSFHPLTAQASFRTDKTVASDAPTFIAGNARTNNTSHTDVHREDDWHDLPVLPMYIVKPPQPRRRGSGLTGSTKVGSIGSSSQKSIVRGIGCALRDAFCCCFRGSS